MRKKSSKKPLASLEHVLKFRRALTLESERGCALLAGAYLDCELEKLLIAKLVSNHKVTADFFRPDGPLGSFSARIDLAYLLGLIGKAARNDLHMIRKIRNEFGHSASSITFDDQPISSRLKQARHINVDGDARKRHRFTNTVMGVLGVIHASYLRCRKTKAKGDDYLDSEFRKVSNEIFKDMLKEFSKKSNDA